MTDAQNRRCYVFHVYLRAQNRIACDARFRVDAVVDDDWAYIGSTNEPFVPRAHECWRQFEKRQNG